MIDGLVAEHRAVAERYTREIQERIARPLGAAAEIAGNVFAPDVVPETSDDSSYVQVSIAS